MQRCKWIYDVSTGHYHNTDMFLTLSIERTISFDTREPQYHIEGSRADGKMLQISERVKDPYILHDRIRDALGV